MNSLLEFIDNTSSTMLEFFNSSNLQMFLLVGSGLLTIGLLILALTRWGHSRPLWKCVVLSVTAHILLLGYAYGTRLILVKPADKVAKVGPAEESPMDVQLVAEDGGEKELAQRVESEKMSWNEFGNDQPLPEIEPLPRPQIDSEIVIKRQEPAVAEVESPDRFAPMPKATLLPQTVPAPVAELPERIAAKLPEPEVFKPVPEASPSTLRILPKPEEVEIPESSQTFVDEMFAREGEFKAVPETQSAEFAAEDTPPTNMLQPMETRPTTEQGTNFRTHQQQSAFVTTSRSEVRLGDGKPVPKMYELRRSSVALAGKSSGSWRSLEREQTWRRNRDKSLRA